MTRDLVHELELKKFFKTSSKTQTGGDKQRITRLGTMIKKENFMNIKADKENTMVVSRDRIRWH
jgi:hypothetical protein